MKHNYNLKYVFSFVAVLFISSGLFSQQVAVTEDGREVYLKSDLEKMAPEKRKAIQDSENTVLINSEDELESMNILTADEVVDGKIRPISDHQRVLNDEISEIRREVEKGRLTEEEAEKKIKEVKDQKVIDWVESGELTQDEASEMFNYEPQIENVGNSSSDKVESDNEGQVDQQESIAIDEEKARINDMLEKGYITEKEAKEAIQNLSKTRD